MTKKCIFIILLLLVFAVFSGCSRKPAREYISRAPFKHPHIGDSASRFDHCRIDRMADDLGLSAEQLEELRNLEMEITKKRLEMRRDRKRREDVKVKIIEMVKEDSLSKEEILSFMDELHSLGEENRKEADSFIAERLAKMHSILTKEQREKLSKKLEEFEPRRKFKPKKDIK
ncbi:Spy/CpxP family protein refolding chaperone [candidate division WOR-3 bacterium]|nr:Spy/CpxP family protein refolding chaperone [candidate division WOR-3 bacterium]